MLTAIQRFFMRPLHAGLLLLFFLLRSYQLNKGLVSTTHWVFSALLLAVIAITCFWVSRFFSRQIPVRWMITTLILVWLLFYGVLERQMVSIDILAPYSRLKLLLPVTGILLLCICIWLGKRSTSPLKTTVFLNSLFLMFLLVECLLPGGQQLQKGGLLKGPSWDFAKSQLKRKPDIYLLIMDEYTGKAGTSGYFHFSNQPFFDSLQQLGLQVPEAPHSDYDYTVFSVASLLNMAALNIKGPVTAENTAAYQQALNAIADNRLCTMLESAGYRIHNKSLFRIGNTLPVAASDYLPQDLELVFHPTVLLKLFRAVPQWLHTLRADRFAASWYREAAAANERLLNDSSAVYYTADTTPDFSYWHFNLPHEPYLFDASGKPVSTLIYEKQQDADSAYIHYLAYSNRRTLTFLRKLIQDTRGEAVLLLLSDHGYRTPDKNPVAFSVLNAVYLPGNTAFVWPDSLHNLEQGLVLWKYLTYPGK